MTQNRTTDAVEEDVIDLLTQHAQIRQLFADVIAASDEQRRRDFDALVRLLAVHETAEEEVVHPLARRVMPDDAATTVDDRLTEEREAKELLSRLDDVDANDDEFDALIVQLRDSVLSHAANEEREEFTWLREECEPATLRRAAAAVRAAEAVAPTHPHPGVESAAGNLVVGPMAAVADRVRDAIRKAKDEHTAGA